MTFRFLFSSFFCGHFIATMFINLQLTYTWCIFRLLVNLVIVNYCCRSVRQNCQKVTLFFYLLWLHLKWWSNFMARCICFINLLYGSHCISLLLLLLLLIIFIFGVIIQCVRMMHANVCINWEAKTVYTVTHPFVFVH